jgi:outer membrane protein OmpA-like peptidoglycan-associated protein
MWLRQIALHTADASRCLEIVGHTSATGSVALNDQLSVLRAQKIEGELEKEVPGLQKSLSANGVGSRELIVGNGRDDSSDALDRRVEFKVVTCPAQP